MPSHHREITMPSEYGVIHQACWILYPHNRHTFRGALCEYARQVVCQVAATICRQGDESVVLFCASTEDIEDAHERLSQAGHARFIDVGEKDDDNGGLPNGNDKADETHRPKISLLCVLSDDTWCRDIGPTFCFSPQKLVAMDWRFNAYSVEHKGYYWPFSLDHEVASNLVKVRFESKDEVELCQRHDFVLEGGSFHVDGEGTLLTTEECLLHANRNPGKTREDLERFLGETLGVTKVLWLPYGLADDNDTNGHVDNVACFAPPYAHVLLSWTDEESEHPENYQRCRANLAYLEQQTDAKGRPLTITKLSLPRPMNVTQEEADSVVAQPFPPPTNEGKNLKPLPVRPVGEPLAASYVNFYVANGAVVVPTFGQEDRDEMALGVLRRIYSDREVVGIYSREILFGGGNFHCITQQVPAFPPQERTVSGEEKRPGTEATSEQG